VTRRSIRTAACLAILIASAGYSYAQFRQDLFSAFGPLRGEQGDPAELPPAEWPDPHVAGCHLLYTSVRRESNGSGWRTDYPWAQRNLLIRLSEMTKTRVSWLKPGVPHVWLVRLTDPALFGCPYVMASDVGTIGLSEEEVDGLRRYLKKGGFLWVDDFWGTYAWRVWESQIRKVLPAGEYPFKDLQLDHPIFNQFFEVTKKAQIPSINHWMAYRDTSERFDDSRQVNIRALTDDQDRVMVLITHNTDFGDSWEREGVSHEYFVNFSVDGYAFGINALLYAMSH
jgi:Domain of unknown function (DUF4159)